MRHYLSVLMISGAAMIAGNAQAADPEVLKGQLATFLGLDKSRVLIECPQQSFSIQQQSGKPVLRICLNQKDNEKRCEIVVNKMQVKTVYNHITFDAKVNAPLTINKQWFGVMQIHSYPDEGEAWRCPPMALTAANYKYDLPNRWDAKPLSVTSGYHCTEAGSSITARNLFAGIPFTVGSWRNFDIYTKLAYDSTGHSRVYVDTKRVSNVMGPNAFNDAKLPFLKLGIYKPSTWETGQTSICVDYRNVKVGTVTTLP